MNHFFQNIFHAFFLLQHLQQLQFAQLIFYHLKLAQFDFLRRTGNTTPLLLLDDIFDKLDASRVEQIVKLVSGDQFGQIFITDTNRDHLDMILRKIEGKYKVFGVTDGAIVERVEEA